MSLIVEHGLLWFSKKMCVKVSLLSACKIGQLQLYIAPVSELYKLVINILQRCTHKLYGATMYAYVFSTIYKTFMHAC